MTCARRRLPFSALLVGLAGCAATPRFDGPIAARNQHPAQLVVARLEPRSAAADAAGAVRVEWRNAHSSLYLGRTENGATFEMDGEYLRTSSLAARVGLGAGVDLAAELPFAHASGGFLDAFLVDWHDLFGFPDQGRSKAPHDRFRIEGARDGTTVYSVGEDGFEPLDVPLALSWAVVPIDERRPFGLLVRGGVELPTGNDERGYGSGGVDWSLGAVGEWRTGPLAWNAHVEHTWATTPAPTARAGGTFADVLSLGVGAEVALSDAWTGLVQVEMDRLTLRDLGLPRAAKDQWLLWTGLRWRLGDGVRLEGGIGEDLAQFIAPDFTAWLALAVDFGGR